MASYVFYGWWDWRFLSLILFSTLVDFLVGRALAHQEKKLTRQVLLWVSILVNLGFLGFFKYYNFFLESLVSAFSLFGYEISAGSLNIILPVGISFYTFQTLSYTIDVYRKKLEPTTDFVAFAAFVSFFPQLVAGPIERASNLLPQFYRKRVFDYGNAIDGMRQMLLGLFKKIVIADTCASYADEIFNSHETFGGMALALGAVMFAFQIYGDFSGYSDIAIGTSRLFGFNLMQNFAFPYFSRDIAEFWRRWHISLSTWFRDYLYIPLGGSRVGTAKKVRNTIIIFVVSGFWHGANWTFIIWGALNAIYFLPLLLSQNNRTHLGVVAQGRLLPTLKEFGQMAITFGLTCFAWIFFRAKDLPHAADYIHRIWLSIIQSPQMEAAKGFPTRLGGGLVIILVLFFIQEWRARHEKHALETLGRHWPSVWRWLMYAVLFGLVILHLGGQKNAFIYFQF